MIDGHGSRQSKNVVCSTQRKLAHTEKVLQVLTLSQILRFDVDSSVTERLRLESLAAMALTYKFTDGITVPQDLKYYARAEYKACLLSVQCAPPASDC
jgi:hypothetical protein